MNDNSISNRLSVIETDIKYITKNTDKLINYVHKIGSIETQISGILKRLNVVENKSNKKELIIYTGLITAIIGLSFDKFF